MENPKNGNDSSIFIFSGLFEPFYLPKCSKCFFIGDIVQF